MKHKGLSFYHSVWFRPGRIKTNYLIKSHEWWLGLGSCLNISVRPKSRHWRNNPNIIGSQCSHDTIERDDMTEIHSQAQVLRGYILPKDINGISKPLTFIISCRDSLDIPLQSLILPICVTVVWRDHCATRGTFLITDKGAPFMGKYSSSKSNPMN